MTDEELKLVSSDLLQAFEADERSRQEWLRTYVDGLKYLGFSPEERSEPFEGSAGVYHPILSEAVVRFQSNAIGEIFPAVGPCLVKVLGDETDEKMHQSKRIKEEMNWQLTENMCEYRNETEQLLFRLPLSGSVFKKVYYDELTGRPTAMMVKAEDFVVDYESSDPETAERKCHIIRRPMNEVKKLMRRGFYRTVDLQDPVAYHSDGREAEDSLTGRTQTLDRETRCVLLEFHVEYDLPGPFEDPDGIANPYIITIDKTSMQVLAIRRNWAESDEFMKPEQYFVHYPYMPGLGAYAFGLIHLLGGIATASTSILRQLIDAGTLSNLPGGLKAKGMRALSDDTPIAPGEWRDVDTGGTPIKDNFFPLPYKEPSAVLAGLLDKLIDEGRRVGSIADVDISGTKQDAPVGTTLALLERSLKVMTAVHARLHAALKKEMRLIARVIHDYLPPQYEWDLEGKYNRTQDFDGRVDVVPVSDPNAATQAQRIVQLQAVQQLAMQNPELYDLKELHRVALQVIGIKDDERILPRDEDPPYLDPVQENMRVLNSEPIKVYQEQDHQAHISAHMAFMTDPAIMEMVGQSPNAPKLQGQAEAHIAEHLGFLYRAEMERELGTELPPVGEPLPPQLEARLSRLIAQAAQQLKDRHKSEMAQREAEAAAEDPVMQLRKRELDIREKEVDNRFSSDNQKMVVDLAKALSKEMLDYRRIDSEEQRAGAKIGADLITWGKDLESKERVEGVKLGQQIGQSMRDEQDAERERELKRDLEKIRAQRSKPSGQ